MAGEISDVSGRRFEEVDLSRTRVHGAFLADTKVTDAWVHSLDLSGKIESLVVNGVEVAGYVRDELERRHPELADLGSKDVPGMQRAWAKVQEIAADTLHTARALPPALLDESVDGEYSYLQTLRHLLFAADRWVTGPVLGEADQIHPLGYPYDSAPPAERASLDMDARPTLDDVLEARAGRTELVEALVRDATDESLARVVDSPNGGTTTVGDCIRVVIHEEWWHHRYANRDLAVLTSRANGS
ncbi:MAG TPA: DinB family protein [Acidimicrobiales bacterium]|nr:DinB family protein [Acidimicrobiales bacterium]